MGTEMLAPVVVMVFVPSISSSCKPLRTTTREKKSWSARYRCFETLQSTRGSVKPATCPEACQTLGCMMIELSMPTTSPLRRTMSFHQQSRMFFFNSAPTGP